MKMSVNDAAEHFGVSKEAIHNRIRRGSLEVSLKKYINTLGLSPKKAQKVKQRFEKRAKRDRRIITLGEKIYLDTLRYDYSDLLKK